MKKFAVTTATLITLVFGFVTTGSVEAAAPSDVWEDTSYVITPSDNISERVTVLISGGATPSAFYGELIGGATYAPVREFAIAMGAASVVRSNNTVSVSADGLELNATAGDIYIEANGRYLYVPEMCLLIGDSVHAPVRVLAEAFGAEVDWSGELMIARVAPGSGPISPEKPYSDEDLYWMSRIITAEARGECFEGQIAVGNIIMNRIALDYYPDTVYGVVFDGIQFTPALTGAIHNTPTEQCILAAKLALEGVRTVGDSLYFAATTKCWANNNRGYYGAVGGHYFYL
ncbi:MAG: copper amine oxidase [Clostridiales bacterium]|nr:copper amine oxidase [Clostridiales bacterium]